jgi:predicted nucleic acid-binding protein
MAEMVIFDSDILIDYFKAIEQAKEFIYSFERARRFVTSISVMEVYRGARKSYISVKKHRS